MPYKKSSTHITMSFGNCTGGSTRKQKNRIVRGLFSVISLGGTRCAVAAR